MISGKKGVRVASAKGGSFPALERDASVPLQDLLSR